MKQTNLTTSLLSTPLEWARSTPLQTVPFKTLNQLGISLHIKREDLLDQRLSGNKLYKLYEHLEIAQATKASQLISFGGYYSNHLHALAHLGQAAGIETLGMVRGHEPSQLSYTLQDCLSQGMTLQFVGRKTYQALKQPAGIEELQSVHPGSYVIPEGGGGKAGMLGCGAIMQAVREKMDLSNATVCVSCGTGTTLSGLLSSSRQEESVLGFSALKLGDQLASYKSGLEKDIISGDCRAKWDIIDELHFGGFAKTKPELFEFMRRFEKETGILLDPVYTAKLLFSVVQLARAGHFPSGHQLVVIHTGGLQGRRGYSELNQDSKA
ncbi:1-aminocyclopropane-1-carboxylate deaminase/D-cysteine desulfhydrase [Pseudomaricurvus sp.]|uniref:1-aminocyclopropane-1-carboxylate deaminase/D-cysteine desulfhydrase n=1 Tax=Pseudomaricurvus sp. TaxID=2004510 RepID=UPI003F6D3915